jgi:RimJ/RimL family protein N-acetyltransferase
VSVVFLGLIVWYAWTRCYSQHASEASDPRRQEGDGHPRRQGDIATSRESDRLDVFRWLTASDSTSAMLGLPLYPEQPAPTWDEFNADYGPIFFDGSAPEIACSYIVEVAGEPVGQINYEMREGPARLAELDIWLRSLADTGHGYGSDALVTLTDHLQRTLGVDTFLIRPSARNPRAVRAYQKAGFVIQPMTTQRQIDAYGAGDYDDTVVLVKRLSAERP